MHEDWHRVFVANGEIEAQQVKTFLEAAGITSVLQGEGLRKTHGVTLDGIGAVEILVAESDAVSARELLASADAGVFRLPEDMKDE